MREKLLRENADPRCKKSRTAIEEPMRAMPITDNEEAMRENVRRDRLEPKCTKSSTATDEPSRAKERKDKAAPIWM
jgi:hypothetical protein